MGYWMEFEELEGKTFESVKVRLGDRVGNDAVIFTEFDGTIYELSHDQDCCEYVHIEEIIGDLSNLRNSPIIRATEDTNRDRSKLADDYEDSHTWTFYNIATRDGHVTIRFYGSSNGYYGESASLRQIN